MSRIQIIDSKERVSCLEVENKYSNIQYLMINAEDLDGDTTGMLYAISSEPSTFGELVALEDKLQAEGIETIIGGEYTSSMFNDIEFTNMRKMHNGQQ